MTDQPITHGRTGSGANNPLSGAVEHTGAEPMNAVARIHDEPAAPTGAMTPMAMLQHAVTSGAGVEVMEKLLALQERWEANQGRRAFDEAIAAAKAEIKPVAKNKTGHNDKRYADFAAYAREVDPVLAKHGLSYRFRTEQDDRIKVTCILSHRDGHSETNSLAGPPDASGSKNAIQAIGSTLTYLQRYTLTQALGLAASDDDDGRSAEASTAAQTALDQISALQTFDDCTAWHEKNAASLSKMLSERDNQAVVRAFNAKRREIRESAR